MQPKRKSGERRRKTRFRMERELRYKVLEGDEVVASGSGATVDMSSGGVCFTAERRLEAGLLVELSISWPALLGGDCPMRLIAFGQIARVDGLRAVCVIERYEFRTQGRTLQMPPASGNHPSLQRWADGCRKDGAKAAEPVRA